PSSFQRCSYSVLLSQHESERPSRTPQASGEDEEGCRDDEPDPQARVGQESTGSEVHSRIEHIALHLIDSFVATANAVLQKVDEIRTAKCHLFEDRNRKRWQDRPQKWRTPSPCRK